MRAAYLPAPGRIEVADFRTPEPAAGEVLVRMVLASICGSDLHVLHRRLQCAATVGRPGFPGHEGVAEVLASRSPHFAPGDRVLTTPHGRLGGCFAELQTFGDDQLVGLPDGDPRRLILAQQLGTTIFAMKTFWPHGPGSGAGRTAAVFGAGSAGLFFLQQLTALGFAHVVVSDRDPHRLAIARSLGADTVVHAPGQTVTEAVADVTGGAGAALAIEAAGYDALRAEAVSVLGRRGVAGFFGYPERAEPILLPGYEPFHRTATIHWVSATQEEPGLTSFRAALDAVTAGTVQVEHCVGHGAPLEKIADAFEQAREHRDGAVKVAIELPG